MEQFKNALKLRGLQLNWSEKSCCFFFLEGGGAHNEKHLMKLVDEAMFVIELSFIYHMYVFLYQKRNVCA